MGKILCVVVLALSMAIGALAGTALAHTISAEDVLDSQDGGFGIFCSRWYQELSHSSNGWFVGGTTHSVYGTFCPTNQDLNLNANDLYVVVSVKRADGYFCDGEATGWNPNIFGSYAWAAANGTFCGAPATGSKRAYTVHASSLYGHFNGVTVTGTLHDSI